MKRVILTKGLPGCGKTTWAKEQLAKHPGQYKRVCKDDLRDMLDGGRWSKKNERFILKVRDSLILAALAEGCHVIVDDTNLHEKHLVAIRELVKGQAIVEIQDFTDVSLETCIERDLARPHSVGERVIRSMYRQFLQKPATPPVYDHALPDAIMCDLDGTLALLNGRDPYDATLCEQDQLNGPIADIVAQFAVNSHTILFTTGRDERFREHTLRWLKHHGFNFLLQEHRSCLFMRPEGDSRPDEVIKREIYEQHILGYYNIRLVLDDRQKIVDLWRSLGLTCLQVAEGDH